MKGENVDEKMQKLYKKDEAKKEEVKLQIYRWRQTRESEKLLCLCCSSKEGKSGDSGKQKWGLQASKLRKERRKGGKKGTTGDNKSDDRLKVWRRAVKEVRGTGEK